MTLSFYADECVDARSVAGLRRRGEDLVAAVDEGLLGVSDERQFERALQLGRVIITADHDFLLLVRTRLEQGLVFPGLIFIQPEASVGEIVRAISFVSTCLNMSEMVNRIEWVP